MSSPFFYWEAGSWLGFCGNFPCRGKRSNLHSGIIELNGGVNGLHSPDQDLHGLDGVAPDNLPVGFPLLLRIPSLVENLHLLEDGALARLTSTFEKEKKKEKKRKRKRKWGGGGKPKKGGCFLPRSSSLTSLLSLTRSFLICFSMESLATSSVVLLPQFPILQDKAVTGSKKLFTKKNKKRKRKKNFRKKKNLLKLRDSLNRKVYRKERSLTKKEV